MSKTEKQNSMTLQSNPGPPEIFKKKFNAVYLYIFYTKVLILF